MIEQIQQIVAKYILCIAMHSLVGQNLKSHLNQNINVSGILDDDNLTIGMRLLCRHNLGNNR